MSFQQIVSPLSIRQHLAVAGQTLLVYDYMLTFRLEMDYIWHARWSAVKLIFLVNRYGNLIGQSFFTLEELGILSRGSQKFCARFPWFVALYAILSEESIHILVLLRAWAIWGCKFWVAVTLISTYVIYLCANVGILIYTMVIGVNFTQSIYLAQTDVCISPPRTSSVNTWILPLMSLSLDSIVFIMVALSLARLFKGSECMRRSPVLRVLAKDATLYFATNAIAGSLAIVCQTVFANDPRSITVVACLPLLTVAGQRVVLNLRRLSPMPKAEPVSSRHVERYVTTLRPSSLWRSTEQWMTDQTQEPGRNGEQRKMQTGSAIELLVIKS